MHNSRPFIFLGVGVLNTLLDFIFYILLTQFIFQKNSDIWIVGLLSGTFALLCAYTTHKLITWRDKPATKSTVIRFILATGVGLWVLRPLLLSWFITWEIVYAPIYNLVSAVFTVDSKLFISTFAFIPMVLIVMIYNYVVYSRFVFINDRTEQENR